MPRFIDPKILDTIYRASKYSSFQQKIASLKDHENKDLLSLVCIQKIASKMRELCLKDQPAIQSIKESGNILLTLFDASNQFDKNSESAKVLYGQLQRVVNHGEYLQLPEANNSVEFDIDADETIVRKTNTLNNSDSSSDASFALDVDNEVLTEDEFEWTQGDSLFVSLYDQLQKSNIPEFLKKNIDDVQKLRSSIIQHIGNNWEKFITIITEAELKAAGITYDSLNESQQELIASGAENQLSLADVLSLDQIRQYVNYNVNHDVCESRASIIAASNLFQVTIIVKNQDGSADTIVSSRCMPNINGDRFGSTIYLGLGVDQSFYSLHKKVQTPAPAAVRVAVQVAAVVQPQFDPDFINQVIHEVIKEIALLFKQSEEYFDIVKAINLDDSMQEIVQKISPLCLYRIDQPKFHGDKVTLEKLIDQLSSQLELLKELCGGDNLEGFGEEDPELIRIKLEFVNKIQEVVREKQQEFDRRQRQEEFNRVAEQRRREDRALREEAAVPAPQPLVIARQPAASPQQPVDNRTLAQKLGAV